jgi:acetoin utilization protein AcuB
LEPDVFGFTRGSNVSLQQAAANTRRYWDCCQLGSKVGIRSGLQNCGSMQPSFPCVRKKASFAGFARAKRYLNAESGWHATCANIRTNERSFGCIISEEGSRKERRMYCRKRSIQVAAIMSPSPVTISADQSVGSALDVLIKHNIRELPVVESGQLVGIVTNRDLRQVSPSYPLFRDQEEIRYYSQQIKVASAMTPDPMSVDPETTVVEAANLLLGYRINSLPVVHEGKLVGIVSVTDILRLFIQQNGGKVGLDAREMPVPTSSKSRRRRPQRTLRSK